jgi:hypothetical protein
MYSHRLNPRICVSLALANIYLFSIEMFIRFSLARIDVLSIPIMCNSLGDIIGASAKVLGNATAAGGNETSSMQGMMASGMQNMSQSELQGLNTLFCSPASEKMIRSIDYNEMLSVVYGFISKYQVDSVYIDGANPSFIKSLKLQIGEDADYDRVIARYRSEGLADNWAEHMKIVPVNFSNARTL